MKLTDTYSGANDPFEGDRMIWLRSLPANARVTKATVTLTPAVFIDVIQFDSGTGVGAWGVTRDPAAQSKATYWAIAHLHTRRSISAIVASREQAQGSNPPVPTDGGRVSVQTDLGGTWVGIASDGTMLTTGKQPLVLTLTKPGEPTSVDLPALTTEKIKLTAVSDVNGTVNTGGVVTLYGLAIHSFPTNVSVRLGQMPPFWTRPGELAAAATSPDFADVLNTFLADASIENAFYTIPLVVHSDAIAQMDVTLDIDYVIEQRVLPPQLTEITMSYSFSTMPGIDDSLTTVALPRQAIPVAGKSGASVQGQFQPTRVADGPIGEEPESVSVEVSPECSLAQALQSTHEIEVIGVDLPLGKTLTGLAGLNVAIRSDDDGKPSSEVLASAEVRVDKPLPDQSTWGSATLQAPFRILPGVRYWLVLQSQIGKAFWNATRGTAVAPAIVEPALQCSRDGGLSWRAATAPAVKEPLAALIRLRNRPERFSIPVQLQIGKGPGAIRRRLDEYAPLGSVEFDFDFAEKLTEHLAKPELASPCGTGELLTNGSFDDPPHDDAARRLFGIDAAPLFVSGQKGTVDLRQGVDLSVERFITLSNSDSLPRLERIDCAGANPARTRLEEIIDAINKVMGSGAAFEILSETSLPSGTGKLGLRGDITLRLWCKLAVPDGWLGIPGRVVRVGVGVGVGVLLLAPPSLFAAGLPCLDDDISALSPMEPAELAQRVPVADGCSYLLRCDFAYAGALTVSETGVPLTFAQWQIRWLDEAGQALATDGADLPVTPATAEGLSKYETRVTAPAGTVEAELRFVQPPPGFLILDDVSFVPTSAALSNGNFQQWETDDTVPSGWMRLSGLLEQQVVPETGQPLVGLRSGGPDDTVLAQTAEVIPGDRYELQVIARPESPPAAGAVTQPDQPRARLELRWLGDGGQIGVPVILPLDGRDFPTHAWSGVAPAGAKQAEIRLIQPKGQGNLIVESVSFTRVDLVRVPLIFLAETPGEMTVGDLRVTYDLPTPSAAELAAPPAPTPAAIGASPQPAKAKAMRAEMMMVSRAEAAPALVVAAAAAAVAPTARHSPLAGLPAGIVAGVGQRFSKILGNLSPPIVTVADLAALDAEASIRNIPRERRIELKATAELIMDIVLDVAPFARLADESLDNLLALQPAELARRAGQPIERAEQLQRSLRALRLLIKNENFRDLRLAHLVPGQG